MDFDAKKDASMQAGKEAIRLVIWDLDETFWRGTVSEGGITEYIQDHHDLIIELAKRGIISSICSKNNFETIEAILKEKGLWEYFILPSIDWSPKGPRIKQLIEDIQLRPETVLFIDDNALNRAEAVSVNPGLQVSDEFIIPTIRHHALFKGKNDEQLTRLKQYQLLQRRKQDEKAVGGDNRAFLRGSNIHVAIIPNIEPHLDRAIELINRTNQLNFTKRRLPDDGVAAKNELLQLANRYFNQAGLVRVWDDYGDYGFCGLYVTHTVHDIKRLVHFCFSCRTLGMEVERWLYQKLGSPEIHINGEVQSDLHAVETIDWINQDIGGSLLFSEGGEESPLPTTGSTVVKALAPEIRLLGGCELDALSHYLGQETPKLTRETNYVNGVFLVRKDATTNMALGSSELTPEIKSELKALALNEADFNGGIFKEAAPGTLFVMSTWGDIYLPVYRHNRLGFEVNVALRVYGIHDLTRATPEILTRYFIQQKYNEETCEQVRQVAAHLKQHYTCVGRIQEGAARENWRKIFEKIPKDCALVVILPNSNRGVDREWALQYHALVRDVSRAFPQVYTLDVTQYLVRKEDQQDAIDHLDRMVYFNIYKDIVQEFGAAEELTAVG